jgi:hypothetical protein
MEQDGKSLELHVSNLFRVNTQVSLQPVSNITQRLPNYYLKIHHSCLLELPYVLSFHLSLRFCVAYSR